MRIRHLTLYTEDLMRMWRFYHDLLGLEGRLKEGKSLSLRAGESHLHFVQRVPATPYHLAFNIPPHTEEEALEWLRKRVEILDDGGREIQDFESWNARSVYFYDPSRNIVEFIARRNLGYEREAVFSGASLREVSEIGLAVTNISPYFEVLTEAAGLTRYDGNLSHFCAIGDEHGLLICIDLSAKTWYPTSDKAYASDFEMDFTEGDRDYRLTYREGVLLITPEHEA